MNNTLSVEKVGKIIEKGKISKKDFEKMMEKAPESHDDYHEIVEKMMHHDFSVDHEYDENDYIEVNNDEYIADDFYSQDILNQYFHDISKYTVLNKKEEIAVITAAKSGDPVAKERLIISNLRLVAKIALHYCKGGIYYLDLIQDGTIGLMTALKKFDISKGYKFSTYATWWIKKEIIDALKKKVNMIKIPNYIYLLNKKIIVFESEYEKKYGEKPTDKEIAKELEVTVPDIIKVRKAIEINMINMKYTNSNENDESDLKDYSTINEIDQDLSDLQRKKHVSILLDTLKPREKQILVLYYGLSEQGKFTFKEIGNELGVSAERVRVLKERALFKLREVEGKV